MLSDATAALALPALVRSARSAEFNYKLGFNTPTNHPVTVQAAAMAERIRVQTDGRVDIRVFPNSQLGGDTDMLSQTRSGALEMRLIPGLVLSVLVPASSIDGIGFAFPDAAAVWRAMDGDLGARVRGQIAKAGLVVMDRTWDNGFRQVTTTTKPIITADDLEGLNVRVAVGPLRTSMFKAFGSSPTSIDSAETCAALQTRIVEAEENPPVVIDTTRLYEVQKYCSMTNHMWAGYRLLFSRTAWRSLPDDLKTVVASNADQAARDERADVARMNVGSRATLEGKGMIFNVPDRASFQAALRDAGFYEQWRASHGEEAWALLEKASGSLI